MFAPDVHAQKLFVRDRVESLTAAAAPRDAVAGRVKREEEKQPAPSCRTTAAHPRSSPA